MQQDTVQQQYKEKCMKRTIRITIITVIIIAIGLVTMFVTPGTWKFGTNVYSNDFQKTPEDSLFHKQIWHIFWQAPHSSLPLPGTDYR